LNSAPPWRCALPVAAMAMMPNSPPETAFFTDKLTHIMHLIWIIKCIQYLLGYAYDSTVWTWTCSDVTKAFLVTYGI
jgi:hypothetical protein